MAQLALCGGIPVRSEGFPQWPQRGVEEETALLAAVREGDWGGFPLPNRCSERFARDFAARHDSRHALCVANGTVSLEIALQALGVEPGAEVIVPAYTFEATAAAVLFAGCAPVMVDVLPHTYCLDPDAVSAAVGPRTQAIVPVHLAMTVADMDRLGELAVRHGLVVLEDCAHAHGARWRGRSVGALGDAGSFSFQTSKLMTAGEGGAVVTSDDGVMDQLYALANCGRQRPERAADVAVIGHNYRMTDLQATILSQQLARLDQQHQLRERRAAVLGEHLAGLPGIERLEIDERVTTQAIYQYVFRYREEVFDSVPRDAFVAALAAEGVPCDGQFYEALPRSALLRLDPVRYPAWAAVEQPPCPVAERAAYRESVWLPHHLLLGSAKDVDQIAEAIAKVCDNIGELHNSDHPAIAAARQARSQRGA